MYAAERMQEIARVARTEGSVQVTDLALRFDVAQETIRRDLKELERRGRLRRVHGGAVLADRPENEPALDTRAMLKNDAKRAIAQRAVAELPHDGTVLADGGTTTLAVLAALPADAKLTVVTNSIPAASLLTEMPGVTVYMVGGLVRGATAASVGDWATGALGEIVADVALIGTNGMSADRGFTTPDQTEAAVKTAMVRAARRVIVVADSSKAADDHLHRFATAEQVDMIITDSDLPDEVGSEFEAQGVEVARS